MQQASNITKIDTELRKRGHAIIDRYFVSKKDPSIRIRVNYIHPITRSRLVSPTSSIS
jgi:hypothetical protein